MKLRVRPILISLGITLGVLFGGWNIYQHFYIQQPIHAFITEQSHVEEKAIDFQQDLVKVELEFKNPDTFATDYMNIKKYITKKTSKKVVLELPEIKEEMKDIWEQEYFSIAEAMTKQEYSEIPRIMEKIKEERQVEKTISRMDEENVYVFLQKGSEHLYAVLPFKEEVKPRE